MYQLAYQWKYHPSYISVTNVRSTVWELLVWQYLEVQYGLFLHCCLHCTSGQFLIFSSQTDSLQYVLCALLQGLDGEKGGLDMLWFGSSTLVPNLRDYLTKRPPHILCSLTVMLSYSDFWSIFLTPAVLQVFMWFVFLQLATPMCFVSIIQIGLCQIIIMTFSIALTFPQVWVNCNDFDLALSTALLYLLKAEALQCIHQEVDWGGSTCLTFPQPKFLERNSWSTA